MEFQHFPSKTQKYDPTIENSYVIKTKINDITYNVSLVDTAGQDEFRGTFLQKLNQSLNEYLD
jgi:GTPase SAR1 family protein